MTVRVFGPDGKEIFLNKKEPRVLEPFEIGFHEAVIGKVINDNPYPPHSTVANEWDDGWYVYTKRKIGIKWIDPKISMPGGEDEASGITFLCLVKSWDGYFSHKPCIPKWKGLDFTLIWQDYQGHYGIQVIEYAHIPMKNPKMINAMQANPNWLTLRF